MHIFTRGDGTYDLKKLSRLVLRKDIKVFLFANSKCKSEIKERIKKTKDEKKARKAEVMAKTLKTQGKANISKRAIPKGSKLGGSGGKH
ncbi:hypothetical protein FNV43_RR24815 [Rhamnella rubrinervis]|uniref:Uncharacterized protein n=1 Tax=Rhamnella rubrinervis TaxID=2594499 RepID=A0A8K0DM81_9ROSA|nr:hypothetical protein FNV43_RR24815 [Rhamnella rubrinervis]